MNLAVLFISLFHSGSDAALDFDTDIIPVLTKSGCNSGACHGAAAGRGEFRLSLLGADPASDYQEIVNAFGGRRVNLADPDVSLLLRKPAGELNHGGDVVLESDSPGARLIQTWIRDGAIRRSHRTLVTFEVSPEDHLCDEYPAEVPLKAFAAFVTERTAEAPEREVQSAGNPLSSHDLVDVTPWTVFTPEDSAAVVIDRNQVAQVRRPGQHVIIARFLSQVVPVRISVPFRRDPVDQTMELSTGIIDTEVLRTLKDLRIPASPPASDAAWLRRVTLDLTGRLPHADETASALDRGTSLDRDAVVDRLLGSDSFTDYWTLRLSQLLHMHSLPNEKIALQVYVNWLREQIHQGVGLDQIAMQLLMATGDSHSDGPSNFHRMVPDARTQAELVSQVFTGMRLGCANCHNHPLDRWTQDDYHGLAAIFSKLDRSRFVQIGPRGGVTNPRTGELAVPRIPGGNFLPADGDHRIRIVQWILDSPENYLARATVNRLWQTMFGRGLIDPVDDIRNTNPATHPELLKQLAEDFAAGGFQIRSTLRQIALSRTYGRSDHLQPGNEFDDRFYSRMYRRVLEPAVLADAVFDVTGIPGDFAEHHATRAVEVIDPSIPADSLDILGRCRLLFGCEDKVSDRQTVTLTTQLHLLNGGLINDRLNHPDGRLRRMLDAGHSTGEIVETFIRVGLGREVREDERRYWDHVLMTEEPDEQRRRLQDFVWAVLNSRDFRENH